MRGFVFAFAFLIAAVCIGIGMIVGSYMLVGGHR